MSNATPVWAEPVEALAPPGPLAEFWHGFAANRGALAALVVLALIFMGDRKSVV